VSIITVASVHACGNLATDINDVQTTDSGNARLLVTFLTSAGETSSGPQEEFSLTFYKFYPRDAMLARYVLLRLSAYLSDRLSQACIVPKRLNIRSRQTTPLNSLGALVFMTLKVSAL